MLPNSARTLGLQPGNNTVETPLFVLETALQVSKQGGATTFILNGFSLTVLNNGFHAVLAFYWEPHRVGYKMDSYLNISNKKSRVPPGLKSG